MRKRGIILMILILMLAFVLTGCMHFQFGNGKMIVGNGQVETKTVLLEKEVTDVYNFGSIDVIIDPELSGEAVIKGESNIIGFVEVEQDAQGSLTVSFEHDVSVSMSRGVTVRIPAVTGGTIQVDGSGNITLDSNEPLKGDAFHVQVQGSGDIRLNLDAEDVKAGIDGSGDINLTVNTQQLTAGIYGSGDITVTGAADSADISVDGSGDFQGNNFGVQTANVVIAGSGDISVNVSAELTGSINGSGDVIYSGNPETVSVSSGGSGDLIKR